MYADRHSTAIVPGAMEVAVRWEGAAAAGRVSGRVRLLGDGDRALAADPRGPSHGRLVRGGRLSVVVAEAARNRRSSPALLVRCPRSPGGRPDLDRLGGSGRLRPDRASSCDT